MTTAGRQPDQRHRVVNRIIVTLLVGALTAAACSSDASTDVGDAAVEDLVGEAEEITSSSTALDGSVASGIDGCLGKDLPFAPYAESLAIECDDEFMYIETDNLADHEMMVGITAWNEQVPLQQLFYGDNSWAVPLHPVFNTTVSETTGLGPIAVAVNGVMIFNPTRQDGVYSTSSDPNLTGELDECGGHPGRGDDYHYHVAPICLEADQLAFDESFEGIVAYAMDGYPIYANSAIPEGASLDECNGLGGNAVEYRYFASNEYPYVNGCFRGDFDADLQPQAPSIREAGTPRSVLITALYTDDDGWNHLEYEADGMKSSINYISNGDDCFDFEFVDDVSTPVVRRSETYCR